MHLMESMRLLDKRPDIVLCVVLQTLSIQPPHTRLHSTHHFRDNHGSYSLEQGLGFSARQEYGEA